MGRHSLFISTLLLCYLAFFDFDITSVGVSYTVNGWIVNAMFVVIVLINIKHFKDFFSQEYVWINILTLLLCLIMIYSAQYNEGKLDQFYRLDHDTATSSKLIFWRAIKILFAVFFLLGMMTRFEILTLISMFGYLILWVAMPAARTVEEKCRMKGKPMKLENFITDMNTEQFRKEVSDLGNSPAVKKAGRIMSGIIGVIIMIAGFAGLMGCFFIPLVPEIFSKHVNLGNLIYGTPLAIASRIIYDNIFWWIVTTMVSILSIWFLYNGAMMAFNFKSPSWKPGLILFLAWIVSILCIAGWSVKIVSEMLPLII